MFRFDVSDETAADDDQNHETVVTAKVMIRALTPTEAAGVGDIEGPLFAVCNEEGKCLAISNKRSAAFAFARVNGMLPEAVH